MVPDGNGPFSLGCLILINTDQGKDLSGFRNLTGLNQNKFNVHGVF